MELEEIQEELNTTKRELRTAQLKIQHYRETLDQKEERTANLRVEITDLQDLLRNANEEIQVLNQAQEANHNEAQENQEQPNEAE